MRRRGSRPRRAHPIGDLRGTAEYKRNVVRVYVERGLRQALASAGKEES